MSSDDVPSQSEDLAVPAVAATGQNAVVVAQVPITNVKVAGDEKKDYRHTFLTDVRGKGEKYVGFDFSYSVITRGYFHKAEFVDCRFIGCRFTDCNFRNASFRGCNFSYADFTGTRIDSDEILESLPAEPNVRQELLQILRKNALSLGDVVASKRFVLAEIDAKREHLRRAWKLDEQYYRNKYSGFWKQLGIGAKRAGFWLDSFLWGHGERLWKIGISIPVLLAVAAASSTVLWLSTQLDPTVSSLANKFAIYFRYYVALFIDIPYPRPAEHHIWMDAVVALCRYLAFGVLISGLFRWLSHR